MFKEDGKTKVLGKKVGTKLLYPIRTKWVARIDCMGLFKAEFVKVNANTVAKSQALPNHPSTFIFNSLFDYTPSVT